jgi:hypothetical protein
MFSDVLRKKDFILNSNLSPRYKPLINHFPFPYTVLDSLSISPA